MTKQERADNRERDGGGQPESRRWTPTGQAFKPDDGAVEDTEDTGDTDDADDAQGADDAEDRKDPGDTEHEDFAASFFWSSAVHDGPATPWRSLFR